MPDSIAARRRRPRGAPPRVVTHNGDRANVRGGTGGDTLVGSDDRNTLDGGDGDDVLDGAGGADSLIGGAGNDTADYSRRTDPVRVSLNDQAGDGGLGENDRLGEDIEHVRGGTGADTITATTTPTA